MSTQRCDGCEKKIRIGGGLGDFWTFERGSTDGLDLELADGTDVFLCFDCIDRLPDDHDVTEADIEALPSRADRETAEAERADGDGDTEGDASDPSTETQDDTTAGRGS